MSRPSVFQKLVPAALAALLALAGSAPLGTAHAEQPPAAGARADAADPRPSFEEGRSLMQVQRFAEAAKKFEHSVAIKPTIGALLNLGDCYEKVGRYASAVKAFDQAKELATTSKDKTREQEAEVRASPLRSVLSTLTVRVPPANKVDGLLVAIDASNDAVAIDQKIPVDGGEHIVKVSAKCRKPHEMRVNVGLRSDAQEVTIPTLAPSTEEAGCGGGAAATTAVPAVVTPASTTTPPPDIGSGTTPTTSVWTKRKTIAVAVGAVGIVGVGVGSFFGLSAIGKKGDLQDRCTSYPNGCPFEQKDSLDKMHSDGQSAATISTIAFIAGAALLVGGVVLFLTAPNTPGAIGSNSNGGSGTKISKQRPLSLTF